MIEQALKGLMVDEVTIAPWAGQDQYGQAFYGAAKTYKARVQRGLGRKIGSMDRSLSFEYVVYVSEWVQVDPRDQLTLPADFGGRDESGKFVAPDIRIERIEPIHDTTGHVMVILYCNVGAGRPPFGG